MSLALQASSVVSILGGMGDGHPPLWYLLIRGAHALLPRPEVLQILAAAVGAGSMALFVFGARFGLLLTGLVLFSREALWLVFLLCMYWIAGRSGRGKARGVAAKAGVLALTALLVLQAGAGVACVIQAGSGGEESQSWDLASLIDRTPALHDAIIIADPDYLVEPLPYYVSNRTYLPREQRFGALTWFTRQARLSLSLGDLLDDAKTLHAATGQPVIILLHHQLDPSGPASAIRESYAWELTMTPDQVDRFLASTRLIQRRAAKVRSDESSDVYLLDTAP